MGARKAKYIAGDGYIRRNSLNDLEKEKFGFCRKSLVPTPHSSVSIANSAMLTIHGTPQYTT